MPVLGPTPPSSLVQEQEREALTPGSHDSPMGRQPRDGGRPRARRTMLAKEEQ